MRLSGHYQEIIKDTFQSVFITGTIYLFGSRADDKRKGGDIDLYIVPASDKMTLEDLSSKKIKLLSKLHMRLGDQKIDIVISKDKDRAIEIEALATGIKL